MINERIEIYWHLDFMKGGFFDFIMEKIKEKALEVKGKIKKIFNERREQIKGFARLFGIVLLVSLATFGVLLLTGVMAFGDDGIFFNMELFRVYQGSPLGTIAIVLILSILTILLCFIPGLSMAFILLINSLYVNPWAAFGIAFARVMVTSTMLYTLGRFGGYNFCKKLLGEADSEKALGLLRDNGTIYFPLMMMFPIFPDDALTMVAGTIKMKLAWFIPSIIIGRGVGTATIIFGIEYLLPDKGSDSYFYDWFILVTVAAFALVCVFYLANKLNKMMALKREGKYKPFKLSSIKAPDRFGIVTAIIVLITFTVLENVGDFFIGPLTVFNAYKWCELIVMSVFWSVLSFFLGRGIYQAYKHSEKYGKPLFMMRKMTVSRFIPIIITVTLALVATIIAEAFSFFPPLHYGYDWLLLISAYIVWCAAIYTISSKIASKIHSIRKHKDDENKVHDETKI